MNVLLIFEEDGCEFFLIKNPNADELKVLCKANNRFINKDEDVDAVKLINDAICENYDLCEDSSSKFATKWANCKIEPGFNKNLDEHVDMIIYCGWTVSNYPKDMYDVYAKRKEV